MSRIDVENAKQIRDPMDVLITMEVPATDITLTYSGYSSAKVADGILGESTWPMRLLADLKGDGFPLDGTRVVYDPNTTASATNGKIGVRSNIGQSVSVTVTGNRTISSLSIFATGAESVTYDGTTSAIVGGQVIIPVGATSITLMFNPASTTERIEVSEIVAGTTLRITNDTLIKAVVSLRSDLSIINQTLPESELNVEAYNDADISEAVANLPEDTPITYQAGYPGDMSPIRKFYVSGQVTWADNVLSIHAVDAVHFLDVTTAAAVDSQSGSVPRLCGTIRTYLDYYIQDVQFSGDEGQFYDRNAESTRGHYLLRPGWNLRELVAFMNNYLHQPLSNGDTPWPTYVDAGIPRRSLPRPQPSTTIQEDDCASINMTVERTIHGVSVDAPNVQVVDSAQIGRGEWIKNVGVSLEYSNELLADNNICFGIYAGLSGGEEAREKLQAYFGPITLQHGVFRVVPANQRGRLSAGPGSVGTPWGYDSKAYPSGLSQEEAKEFPPGSGFRNEAFAAFIPWDAVYESGLEFTSQTDAWARLTAAGIMGNDATSIELAIAGGALMLDEETIAFGDSKTPEEISFDKIAGALAARPYGGGSEKILYPDSIWSYIQATSPITCSFTWKGDPRIQPRDVFTFHRLDGTDEDWTFENITLTHEKGGTVAEITARKGIV